MDELAYSEVAGNKTQTCCIGLQHSAAKMQQKDGLKQKAHRVGGLSA
jgi:hypothetical protein